MTEEDLRGECEDALQAIDTCGETEQYIEVLMAFAHRMQAVGVRRAGQNIKDQHQADFGHTLLYGVEKELFDWCEAEAVRLEGMK